ncbi:HAD family hydrolase [Tardisphaera miroshnichenkoae]
MPGALSFLVPLHVEAVIFDLDGTLLDSREAFIHQNLDILKEFGHLRATLADAKELLGMSPTQILSKMGVSESEHKKYVAKIDASYIDHYMKKYTKPFPGVIECLERLKKAGVVIGVATNTTREILEQSLRWAKLDGLVDAAVCADGTIKEKPEPDMLIEVLKKLGVSAENAIYVGDTELDVVAAKNAGVPSFITVSGGIGKLDAIMALKPDALVPTAAWLCKIVSFHHLI